MQYVPIGLPFFLAFWFLVAVLITLIEIGVLSYAFESMGVNRRYMFALLVFCLLGSYINIPVAELAPRQVESNQIVEFFGMEYVVPYVANWQRTVIAVNVGGALIPFVLSMYLLVKTGEYGRGLLAVVIVTMVVHSLARPVHGVGIAVPTVVPPLITALVAVSLSRRHAAPLAYIAGSLGTLIGADLMNLNKIQGLGAPVASIGGAGKFDGIFLTGLLAVLLAGFLGGQRRAPRTT